MSLYCGSSSDSFRLDALAACACLIEPVLRFNFRQLLIDRMRLPFFNFAYGTFALAAR